MRKLGLVIVLSLAACDYDRPGPTTEYMCFSDNVLYERKVPEGCSAWFGKAYDIEKKEIQCDPSKFVPKMKKDEK